MTFTFNVFIPVPWTPNASPVELCSLELLGFIALVSSQFPSSSHKQVPTPSETDGQVNTEVCTVTLPISCQWTLSVVRWNSSGKKKSKNRKSLLLIHVSVWERLTLFSKPEVMVVGPIQKDHLINSKQEGKWQKKIRACDNIQHSKTNFHCCFFYISSRFRNICWGNMSPMKKHTHIHIKLM